MAAKFPDRGCRGKVQFVTHDQAEVVRQAGYTNPQDLHVYRCSKGHWHIGSRKGKHKGVRTERQER